MYVSKVIAVPSPPVHTPAGRGTAKTQESCGLINYHLKETKVDVSWGYSLSIQLL